MVLVARRGSLLAQLADDVARRGGTAWTVERDLTLPNAAREVVENAIATLSTVDIAILNAGRGGPYWIHEMNVREAELVTEVNYLVPLRMIAGLLPHMVERRHGHIVAVSSLASFRGMPGSGPYNASKGALNILMESIRIELAGTGVATTVVLPGFVRTEMTASNEFHMPLIMTAERAARRIVRDIDRKRAVSRFPFVISCAVRLMNAMPHRLFDALVRRGRRRLARAQRRRKIRAGD